MTKHAPLLKVEPYPSHYEGFQFLSLIQYNEKNILLIVDNILNNNVIGFVVEQCYANSLDPEVLLAKATAWRDQGLHLQMPLSIFLARYNLLDDYSVILKSYPIDSVSRIIGSIHKFEMKKSTRIRRKKHKTIVK